MQQDETKVIALFSVRLIRIRIDCGMVFDSEGFTRVVLELLSTSTKNVSEIQSCWCEIRSCINNMEQTVESFIEQEQNRVDEHQQYIYLGSGKCGSTIVNPGGYATL